MVKSGRGSKGHERSEKNMPVACFGARVRVAARQGRQRASSPAPKNTTHQGWCFFRRVKNASQSLPPAGGKKSKSFFTATCAWGKYLSDCKCGILPLTAKLCAQQAASLLSEKPGGFFDSLKKVGATVFRCTHLAWQREKDSNPHIRSQSPLCYLYTIPLCPEEQKLLYRFYAVCQQFFSSGRFFLPDLWEGVRQPEDRRR